MRTHDHGLLSNATSLLLCGLLAGLVVAAAAFPAIAMAGLGGKAAADTFAHLPSDISVPPAPQISYVYASDGQTLLAALYDENRRDVPLSEVAPVMQQAMIAAEDSRFYNHHGVDVKGVVRAWVANQQTDGRVSQGASTLTMQYVRQVISYSARTPQEVIDATEQTPARKVREMKYAVALEKKLTKAQILERYLNIAAYGHGAYGIFAASQVYFGKAPKDLTLEEAALLAGLVKAPSDYDPATEKGRPKALDRRVYVLNQMIKMEYITQQQADAAQKKELKVVGKRTPEGCTSVQRPELGGGFFCDYLVRWWLSQKAFGADAYERENRLRSGGYTITSSLDLTTQTAAFTYSQTQPGLSKSEIMTPMGGSLAMMLAAIEPGSGRVKALATNRQFSNDQTNNGANTNPAKGGQKGNYPNTTVPMITGGPDIPGYQAGSAFKIFTMVAALENGYPLEYTINAVSPAKTKFIVEEGSDAACPGTHFYCPENASSSMNGVQNMWTAFGKSVNTYFVPLEERVGADKVVEMAKRMGIQFRSETDAKFANGNPAQWGAFTLGVSATTPLELANAYATIAADGVYCEPIPVLEIRDFDGNKVDAANPRCKSVITQDVARAAVDAARCPVGDGSSTGHCKGGTASYLRDIIQEKGAGGTVRWPIAGKTGTTDSEKSATMTVMTKQLAVSGFLTDPDWPQTNRKMQHPPVNRAAAYTLRDGMVGKPIVNFVPPSKSVTTGTQVSIPNVKCQSVEAAKRALARAGFSVDVASEGEASDCPAGTVARTDPSGKTIKGGAVMIIVSSGPGAVPGPGPGPGTGGGVPGRPTGRPTIGTG